MTGFRLIPLTVHTALELIAGVATMGAPFVFGFGNAGTVVAVVAGALFVALAVASAPAERPGTDRGTLSLGSHYALDQLLGFGLVIAALALASAGDRPAALFLALVAVIQTGLGTVTRYSPAT